MEKLEKEKHIISLIPIVSVVFAIVLLFVPCFGNEKISINLSQILFGLDGYPVAFISYCIFLFPIAAFVLMIIYKKNKNLPLIAAILLIIAGIFLIFGNSYLSSKISSDICLFGIGIATSIIYFLCSISCFSLSFIENELSIEDIVEIAMLIALAIVLDLPGLKIRLGNNGGSLSFTMLPLMILALRKGAVKGFLATGVIYGVITCTIDGWGFVTYPFDYLLAYGSLAVLGFFNKLILPDSERKITFWGIFFLCLGVLLSGCLRFLSSSVSGVIVYELDFVASMVYNAPSILGSTGICLAALILLYKPLLIINNRYKAH